MSDVLIAVEAEQSVKVLVRELDGSVREVSEHSDHLTAFKAVNRLNFVRGHRLGVVYFVEGEQ